jgi:hypothetical protein
VFTNDVIKGSEVKAEREERRGVDTELKFYMRLTSMGRKGGGLKMQHNVAGHRRNLY